MTDIYGARVSTAGTVLDPGGVPLVAQSYDESGGGVSWDGTSFLLGWQDHRATDAGVYASRMSSEGVLLDAGGFPLFITTGGYDDVGIATLGDTHLVVFDYSSGGTGGVRVMGRRHGT